MEGQLSRASLVVGGTGMLATATRWLAGRSAVTLLVARRAGRFAAGDRRFTSLDADWREPGFPHAVAAVAPIDRALLWLHEPEPVLPWLLPLLSQSRTVLVLGSPDGRPRLPAGAPQVVTVRLGSKPAGGGRRWLTDAEISEGAIAALDDGRSRIVGDLSAP